jgi:hypothetical protein
MHWFNVVKSKFRCMRDSRGKTSWTHTLAIPIVILITIKMLAGGIDLTIPGGYRVTTASVLAIDYVEMVKYWIGLFFARETTEKVIDYLVEKNGSSIT